MADLPRAVELVAEAPELDVEGSLAPFLMRRSPSAVPPGWLAYSTSSRASLTPRVPRLIASMISVPAFSTTANSCRPKALVSTVCQAQSRRRGRSSTGPTPSSQL